MDVRKSAAHAAWRAVTPEGEGGYSRRQRLATGSAAAATALVVLVAPAVAGRSGTEPAATTGTATTSTSAATTRSSTPADATVGSTATGFATAWLSAPTHKEGAAGTTTWLKKVHAYTDDSLTALLGAASRKKVPTGANGSALTVVYAAPGGEVGEQATVKLKLNDGSWLNVTVVGTTRGWRVAEYVYPARAPLKGGVDQ